MPLFLVINPQQDNEMFYDGQMESCKASLRRRIIEAGGPDEAIIKTIQMDGNGLDHITPKDLQQYFCLEVANTYLYTVSNESLRQFKDKQIVYEKRREREADLIKFEALKKKLGF